MYFPIFINLQNKKCVIIGGGKVAERKAAMLMEYGAEIVLVSPNVSKNLLQIASKGKISIKKKHYENADIDSADLIFSTTNDKNINEKVSIDAKKLGIPVNIADDPQRCDFIYPSIIKRGDLTIAISTNAKCPAFSKFIRRKIEGEIGPEYEEYLKKAANLRESIICKEGSSENSDELAEFIEREIAFEREKKELTNKDKIDSSSSNKVKKNCI